MLDSDLLNHAPHLHVFLDGCSVMQRTIKTGSADSGQLTHSLDAYAASQRHHFLDFVVDAFSALIPLFWRRASTFCKAPLKKSSSNVLSTSTRFRLQYVATGTFSAPPLTVTPLPVNWCVKLAPLASPGVCGPPGNSDPGITSQGLATCGTSTLGATVTPLAPSDSKLPLNAQGVPMVSGSAALDCP